MNLYIKANRNGYSTDDTGETMTVNELIELLQNAINDGCISGDEAIYTVNGNYTNILYGNISDYDIYAGENYSESENIY